jgi:HAD superfamily hydrolase (TIGR01509 family)
MINDMPYHISAWHKILTELGADISMDRMKEECYGKNHELLERMFPGRFTENEKNQLSLDKEKKYQEDFKPNLKLIDGLGDFLKQGHEKGKKIAVGSAAITFNIDFVLDGLNIRQYIDAIVSADNVQKSKPDPETWVRCMEQLNAERDECLVFEDAPKGAESALNAGIDCIIITTLHRPEEFYHYNNVIAFINDFKDQALRQLLTA